MIETKRREWIFSGSECELLRALILAQWYLDRCGENVAASNLRCRIFGFDPFKIIPETKKEIY